MEELRLQSEEMTMTGYHRAIFREISELSSGFSHFFLQHGVVELPADGPSKRRTNFNMVDLVNL
jgi:hypothetical protein